MAQSPRVSVIVPTVGRPQLLLECVDSILHNDFTDFEIIVVDQDAEQGLERELSRMFGDDARIVYLFLDHAGLSRARNRGVERARGEIIVFADDDVAVEADWLTAYVDAFTTLDPAPGVVAGRLKPLWPSAKPEWLPEEREYLLGIYDAGDELTPMPQGDLPIGANFAAVRRVVDEVSGFDERVGFSHARNASMIGGEDSLFCLRAQQADYSIYYQPRAKAWHKISRNKLSKRHFLRRNFWEGVTTLVVLYLSGSITPKDFPGILRWHIRNIADQLFCFFVRGGGLGVRLLDAKGWMRLGATCLHSVAVICYSTKFLLTRRLP